MSLNLCRWGTINLKGKSWGKKDTVSLPRSESFDLPLLRSSFETWRRNSSPWGEERVGQPVEAEEMQRVTVNESLTGLRVPAPTSLCGSRILLCPWGHWWDYSNCDCVTMMTCWCVHTHTLTSNCPLSYTLNEGSGSILTFACTVKGGITGTSDSQKEKPH